MVCLLLLLKEQVSPLTAWLRLYQYIHLVGLLLKINFTVVQNLRSCWSSFDKQGGNSHALIVSSKHYRIQLKQQQQQQQAEVKNIPLKQYSGHCG